MQEGKLIITLDKDKQKLDKLESLIKVNPGQLKVRKIDEQNKEVIHIRGMDADTSKRGSYRGDRSKYERNRKRQLRVKRLTSKRQEYTGHYC
ncbi:hypothetical protein NQ314_006878 [Rhamnusium bicolor]|uniref:Uncharacterized protein n=1 Tax=Rhamnusium bicolor TaxID=1586634 RepID=A0AAV8YXT3_9CUCU|nr:hypothetical protein NQ314_006878 [Rhamnusium bicolor]